MQLFTGEKVFSVIPEFGTISKKPLLCLQSNITNLQRSKLLLNISVHHQQGFFPASFLRLQSNFANRFYYSKKLSTDFDKLRHPDLNHACIFLAKSARQHCNLKKISPPPPPMCTNIASWAKVDGCCHSKNLHNLT